MLLAMLSKYYCRPAHHHLTTSKVGSLSEKSRGTGLTRENWNEEKEWERGGKVRYKRTNLRNSGLNLNRS
jgi:hypothetical protein